MAIAVTLRPISDRAFGYAEARHLLSRAGFGGTPAQIAALQGMGLIKAVDHLVEYHTVNDVDKVVPEYDANIIRPRTPEERRAIAAAEMSGDTALRDRLRAEYLMRQEEDRRQMGRLEQWWLGRIIATPRPLEEKLVLLWHGHFASNHRTVQDSYLMLQQNALFRQHAAGNFGELVAGVIRDPAMIHFLNNNQNRKAAPNENLARELMELFTLGEGHYTESDIREGARALTGYHVNDNDFSFNERQHDHGQKAILGQRGLFKGEDFVRLILSRPQCPVFVASKLYRHFVGDIDDKPAPHQQAVISQMARMLLEARYELKPVLKALFRSEHFYDPAVRGAMIKSPAQLVAGTIRTLRTPVRQINVLADAMDMMGQRLFEPPSVAGWAGGRGWINTSTLFVRQNLAAYLISGKLPFEDGWSRETVDYDPMFVLDGLESREPEAVVDRVLGLLLGDGVTPERRSQVLTFFKDRRAGVTEDTVVALLLLVTATPEYQLC